MARENLEKCNSIFSEFGIIDILENFNKYLFLNKEEHRRSLLESSNILQFIYCKGEDGELQLLRANSMFFINQIFRVMEWLYRKGENVEAFVLSRMAEHFI